MVEGRRKAESLFTRGSDLVENLRAKHDIPTYRDCKNCPGRKVSTTFECIYIYIYIVLVKFSIGGSHPDMHLKPGDRRAPLSGSKVSLVAELPGNGGLPTGGLR